MSVSIVTENQWNLIAHSIGVDVPHAKRSLRKKEKFLPDEFYRNHFCSGKNTHEEFEALEKFGLVKKVKQWDDQWFYFVTDEGQKEFRKYFEREVTMHYVPLTKAKEKYQDYLNSDGWYSFADYLQIWMPEYERRSFFGSKTKRIRMVSTNPNYDNQVRGEYCKDKKEAKISYKLALKNEKTRK